MALIKKGNSFIHVTEQQEKLFSLFVEEHTMIKALLNDKVLHSNNSFVYAKERYSRIKRIKELESGMNDATGDIKKLKEKLISKYTQELNELESSFNDSKLKETLHYFGLEDSEILKYLYETEMQIVIEFGRLTTNKELKQLIQKFFDDEFDYQGNFCPYFITGNPDLYQKVWTQEHPVVIVENFKHSLGLDGQLDKEISKLFTLGKRLRKLNQKYRKINTEILSTNLLLLELRFPVGLNDKLSYDVLDRASVVKEEIEKTKLSMIECIKNIEKMNLYITMEDVEEFFNQGFEGEKIFVTQTNFVFCVLKYSLTDWLLKNELI